MTPKSDQGMDHVRYQVVPRVLIFLFDHHNRVLLLKGSAQKRLWAGLYNGIGGHIEAGEDILEAAHRELFEETGILDLSMDLCGQIMVDVAPQVGVAIFVFKGAYHGTSLTPSDEGMLSWVNLEDLDSLDLVEDLPVLLPKIAVHGPSSPMIIAKYTYDGAGNLRISFR
ncbi:MAG: NUDIX domain-containing protein [Brevefilum sp.]|nr:NUDIX domain-containing protein [Brevefilum sp.]